MSKITLDNLSDNLKAYLEGLGLTEAQVQELIDKFEDEKIGDISQLSTEEKGSLVEAINDNKTSILDINENLGKSENTKYSTENGVKEFNCKDGYVDIVYIEGETLVNLCHYVDGYGIIDTTYFKYFDNRITGHDVYTVCFPNLKDGGGLTLRVVNKNGDDVEAIPVYKGDFKTINIGSSNRITAFLISLDKYTEEEIKNICETGLIVPGDHTDKPISYFEGLKSVGQGNKIEVLSLTDNLFSKDDFVVGSTNSIVGDKFVIDSKVNRITHRTPIPVQMYEYLEFDYAINNINTYLYELDSNDNILKAYGWSKYSYVRAITPNTKYIRIIFSYEDGRDMSLDDYDRIRPFLTPKYDKKTIPHTLRSLPNGIKDTIEKRGNKYVKVQRCGEVTLSGYENYALNITQTSTLNFVSKFSIPNKKFTKEVGSYICNNLSIVEHGNAWDKDVEGVHSSDNSLLYINVSKSKLSSEDVEGFKTWLQSNPITVVYELETPQIIELPNFNPQTYSDNTTLLINSGAIQGECEFEVTNSKGSEIEVLKDKVSSIDNNTSELETRIAALEEENQALREELIQMQTSINEVMLMMADNK